MPTETRGSAAMLRIFGEVGAAVNSSVMAYALLEALAVEASAGSGTGEPCTGDRHARSSHSARPLR
jgi:hypothetical protein